MRESLGYLDQLDPAVRAEVVWAYQDGLQAAFWVTAALCAVLYVFFKRTRVGIAMQASSQNQLAAYYMGIPVRRINTLIWGISAGVAAFAAVLLAPITLALGALERLVRVLAGLRPEVREEPEFLAT